MRSNTLTRVSNNPGAVQEFVKHWNPNEPKTFFWVDDAFGATQYQHASADECNRIFPHVNSAITKGARLLFTSRDYIYNAARSDLKTTAFPLLDESQVVIEVQDLEENEKAQILYNHIKLGNQPKTFRKRVKPVLRQVAQNPRFLPEVARRLGDKFFTKGLALTRQDIELFVEEPVAFLRSQCHS